jgi:deoxyadenosine/deoxycytidine kinase/NTP pyrophosphatase (non-canonical NTP hydrolase)
LSPDTLNHPWYIIIEGAIGVGKTTLARMLSQHLGTGLLLEVFEENPFLAKFYESRARYAFQTQMFFLLSRYRQQQQQVPQMASRDALISDYMFAKDRLFAQLNLAGDEWEIYQQIHSALAEQIPAPDLIVYLQADTDVLMGRIAQRDRPYERAMDGDYIEALRHAYEQYLPQQDTLPVLTIDTNHLNYISNPDDLQSVVERIRSVLREGVLQQPLPEFEAEDQAEALLSHRRPLSDYQRFHVELDQIKGFNTDMYFNHLLLSEEVGELSRELARLWVAETSLVAQGLSQTQAREKALLDHRGDIESELADCMAYLLKLANYAGIDLETAYLEKMKVNQDRSWFLP